MSRLLAFALLVFVISGCGSSSTTHQSNRDRDPNTVQAEDVEGGDLKRVEDMLRGQIAGVTVRQGPSGLIIRIRGASESNLVGTPSDPLFVIDGLPIQLGANGALEGINPRDIASIRILKNVSETALYGARGANGVVLITTFRPPPPEDDPEKGGTQGG